VQSKAKNETNKQMTAEYRDELIMTNEVADEHLIFGTTYFVNDFAKYVTYSSDEDTAEYRAAFIMDQEIEDSLNIDELVSTFADLKIKK
jgi:hypothetical protein